MKNLTLRKFSPLPKPMTTGLLLAALFLYVGALPGRAQKVQPNQNIQTSQYAEPLWYQYAMAADNYYMAGMNAASGGDTTTAVTYLTKAQQLAGLATKASGNPQVFQMVRAIAEALQKVEETAKEPAEPARTDHSSPSAKSSDQNSLQPKTNFPHGNVKTARPSRTMN